MDESNRSSRVVYYKNYKERIFKENPLHSKDGQGMSSKVIARFYLPGSAEEYLITEAGVVEGQWFLYGYCNSPVADWGWGMGWGYIRLE